MARSEDPSIAPPSEAALREIFRLKYGDPATGWGPQMRMRAGYFNPDDHYEALVAGLVRPQTVWLDVGCGRDIFPSNRALARLLADRCRRLVGFDPDVTIEENPFIHERRGCPRGIREDRRALRPRHRRVWLPSTWTIPFVSPRHWGDVCARAGWR